MHLPVLKEDLQRYLARVYREPNEAAPAALTARALSWWYDGVPHQSTSWTCEARKQDLVSVQSACSTRGILVREDSVYRQYSTLALNDVGRRSMNKIDCRRSTPLFAPDNTLQEVVRVPAAEGGPQGCWFVGVRSGSGVFLNVSKSLRVENREALMARLNISFEPQTTRSIRRWPYDLEQHKIRLCPLLRAHGFDTLQIGSEWRSQHGFAFPLSPVTSSHVRPSDTLEHEIVSCHWACTTKSLPSNEACVPGLPLNTGWRGHKPCRCRRKQKVLNCLNTTPSLKAPWLPRASVEVSLSNMRFNRASYNKNSSLNMHQLKLCSD